MQKKTTHLIVLSMVFGLLSAGSIHGNGGHGHSDPQKSSKEHHWKAPPEEAKRLNPIPDTFVSVQRGKALFAKSCVVCHGEDARGDGPAAEKMDPRPTDLFSMAGSHTDGDLAWKIAAGRGAMPGWKDSLTEKQIWDIVNFIQSLGSERPEQEFDPVGVDRQPVEYWNQK